MSPNLVYVMLGRGGDLTKRLVFDAQRVHTTEGVERIFVAVSQTGQATDLNWCPDYLQLASQRAV